MRLDVYGDGSKIEEIQRPAVIVSRYCGNPILIRYGEYEDLVSYIGNYKGIGAELNIEPKLIEMVDHKDFQDIMVDKNRFMDYFKVI